MTGRRRAHTKGQKLRQQTPNAQRPTSNPGFSACISLIGRWTPDVGRFLIQIELIHLIRAEIERNGPVPFAWFMEQALYHPEHGYYSSGRAEIGRCGDYFTNVSIGPLFGELLAFQFAEIWQRLGRPGVFTVVEQGAHHGEFARDFLGVVERRFPELFAAVRYQIVEPFPNLQNRQAQTLAEFRDRIDWRGSLDQLEPFVGIHFSNELLDAMPINLERKLVDFAGDKFIFVDFPNAQKTNQPQLDWIANVAAKLKRGVVLAIDYGFPRNDFREIVQARARHRNLDSPFEKIGEADIAAHINWTDIAEAGEENGLTAAGFADQHHFLAGIIATWPGIAADEKSRRALKTLLHPEMLGRAFQVLALTKDIELAAPLGGFKFARGPRQALGLCRATSP